MSSSFLRGTACEFWNCWRTRPRRTLVCWLRLKPCPSGHDREGVARTLPADVRAALAELTHARRSTAAARASAEDAALVLSMTDQAYRAGGTTNLEVIDAERRARDADNAAAVAEDVERQATLDLLAASGRFPR